MKILKDFGQKIKEKRLKIKISQEELAFRVGLHRTYVSDVERGNRNISLINIGKIAKGLGVSVKELFDENGPK